MFCEMLLDEIHALYILGLAELWKIDQHLKHLITVCQTAGKLFTQMGFLLLWHMAFCKGYNTITAATKFFIFEHLKSLFLMFADTGRYASLQDNEI